jgi:photosystem II oxygen-evolving enhancer protein 2
VKAGLALPDLCARSQQGIRKTADLLFGLAEQMQGQSLCGAGTNSWKTLELVDQPSEWSGESAQSTGASGENLSRGWDGQNGAHLVNINPTSSMRSLLRQPLRSLLVLLCVLMLSACGGASAGLNSFKSPDGRYAFLYPTGWTRVAVTGGPAVVFHDLINSDETVSLVVSDVDADDDLQALGSAVAVGERLRREVIAPDGSGRDAELVEARERESEGHVFYDLEYAVHLQDRDRHELATVVVDRGRLYTLATSTNEARWPKVKGLFESVISSFTLLI